MLLTDLLFQSHQLCRTMVSLSCFTLLLVILCAYSAMAVSETSVSANRSEMGKSAYRSGMLSIYATQKKENLKRRRNLRAERKRQMTESTRHVTPYGTTTDLQKQKAIDAKAQSVRDAVNDFYHRSVQNKPDFRAVRAMQSNVHRLIKKEKREGLCRDCVKQRLDSIAESADQKKKIDLDKALRVVRESYERTLSYQNYDSRNKGASTSTSTSTKQ